MAPSVDETLPPPGSRNESPVREGFNASTLIPFSFAPALRWRRRTRARPGGEGGEREGVLIGNRPSDVAAAPDLVIDLRDPERPQRIERPAGPPPRRSSGARSRRTALLLLVALNSLNLLDAVLTFALVEAGIAREGNPVVDWMTLPGKAAFVAALSVLLWKLRPRALVVPVVGYSVVVSYTLAGAALTA